MPSASTTSNTSRCRCRPNNSSNCPIVALSRTVGDPEVLMSRADQTMFESKRAGRCRIRWLNGALPQEELDLSALWRTAEELAAEATEADG